MSDQSARFGATLSAAAPAMAPASRAPRVLVVDDERELVRVVRAYLEQAGFQVQVAYDGETCLQVVRQERPDLLLLDLMLPDRDGWEITRTIRSDRMLAALPIIMLTARAEDADKIVGLELGADDYITKPYNPREVVARVRALLRRSQALGAGSAADHGVLRVGELCLDPARHEVTVGGRPVDLTPTEFRLLEILLEYPGYVHTRTELIERALGYDYGGVERTLDSHIRNLRQKIEREPGRPSYIQTVYGVGYRLATPALSGPS